MRKNIVGFLFIILTITAISQPTFLGMTSQGGDGMGTIFKTDGNGNNQIVLSTFTPNVPGASPSYPKLCEAPNSKLYGMTEYGGANNLGVIFEYDIVTNIYTKKIDLNDSDGCSPQGSLILASNGKLYGMTSRGGLSTFGVIFEYDYVNNVYTKKLDLNSVGGNYPLGSLMEASNGKMYGMTFYGGVNNKGVVFEYDFNSNIFAKKIDLTTSTGYQPRGSLMEASNSKLYGLTTKGGGSTNGGSIFEYDYTTNTFTKKMDFSYSIGYSPFGSLLEANNGKLYGLTSVGSSSPGSQGVLFEYDYITNSYIVKTNLTNISYGSLIQASNNKLYGLGTHTLFEFDYVSGSFITKFNFTNSNGFYADGTLIEASNGKLYAAAKNGINANSAGGIFEYNYNLDVFIKKIEFGGTEGNKPYGSLMLADNGKFYGTTLLGGLTNEGTLFEYNYGTNTYLKKIDFNSVTGKVKSPVGKLIQAPDGKLYGLAQGSIYGSIYQYDYSINSYSKKVAFDTLNMYNPYGSLILAQNGKLYGLVSGTGSGQHGGIFEYNYTNNACSLKVSYSFGNNGTDYFGSLIDLGNGKLYGMARGGGANNLGVIFEYDYNNETYVVKYNFDGINGSWPLGDLTYANNGKLYGMTAQGGTNNVGVIFEYDVSLNTYTKKIDLNSSIGCTPNGSLMQASNGKLYGMTNKGGVSNYGVVFEYDYSTNVYTKKNDFTGVNGSTPETTNLIEVCTVTPMQPVTVFGDANPCQGELVTYSVASVPGATFYSWTLPSGWTGYSTTNTISVTPNAISGNISVTADNVCFSSLPTSLSVAINPMPSISVSSGTICSGQSFTITATGADTYTYTGGSAIISPTSTTSYSITGTDINGCVSLSAISNVIVNALPVIVTNNGAICSGQFFTIIPTGASTYTYSGGTDIVSPLADATYSVNGTDVNGCISSTPAVSNVTVNALPVVTANDGVICNGQSFTITPIGANTYTYSGGTNVVSPSANTSYSVTGTDSNGCESLAAAVSNVTVNALPSITASSSNTLLCVGETATLTATGSTTYTWSTSENTSVIVITPTVNTVYSVSTIDANSCSNMALVTVSVSTCTDVKSTVLSDSELLIFPNPTNGILNIAFTTVPQNTKLEVYNTVGALVRTEMLSNKINTINIADLSTGMYFVKVFENGNVITVKKVVKN